MNLLLIILVILIVLSILYLYYRNIQYNNILESFDNNYTQSSLSTYFQDTINSDSLMTNKNKFNRIIEGNILPNQKWNGIWKSKDSYMYAQFLEKNENLIIFLSNASLNETIQNNTSRTYEIGNYYEISPTINPSQFNITIRYIDESNCSIIVTKLDGTGWGQNIIVNIYNIDHTESYSATINSTTSSSITQNFNTSPIKLIKNSTGCYDDSFLGRGILNNDRTFFILKEVICNNYFNSGLNLRVNELSGKLNENEITLFSNNTTTTLTKLRSNASKSNLYLNSISPNNTLLPNVIDSKYLHMINYCTGDSKRCNVNDIGLGNTSWDNGPNACGTPTSGTDLTCNGPPTCVISETPGNYTKCQPVEEVFDYMNFMPMKGLLSSKGNMRDDCAYLEYFSNSRCNACIMCYVSELRDVQTLNYEFFGPDNDQNSLTIQYDIIDTMLNNPNKDIGILNTYRNALNNNSGIDIDEALSLTNIIENNTTGGNPKSIYDQGILEIKEYINKNQIPDRKKNRKLPKFTKGGNRLVPCIWQINNGVTLSKSSECNFTLSTYQDYKTYIKYITYNNGNINLSLFNGGNSQKFMLENATILKKSIKSTGTTVLMSGNLKTLNNLYLIPASDTTGFSNNSNVVRLSSKPEDHGKWLIIGFSLNNLTELSSVLNNISF